MSQSIMVLQNKVCCYCGSVPHFRNSSELNLHTAIRNKGLSESHLLFFLSSKILASRAAKEKLLSFHSVPRNASIPTGQAKPRMHWLAFITI